MKFVWNEIKNQQNILKHGIDFYDAVGIFESVFVSQPSQYALEERYLVTGFLNEKEITLVYTNRPEGTRIISARRARKGEARLLRSFAAQN